VRELGRCIERGEKKGRGVRNKQKVRRQGDAKRAYQVDRVRSSFRVTGKKKTILTPFKNDPPKPQAVPRRKNATLAAVAPKRGKDNKK